MKFLRIFLIIHIIFSLLLLFMIFFGTEVFDALGWDVPWDEIVSEANARVRDAVLTMARGIRPATIWTADRLAHVMQTASDCLSSWVAAQQA